VIPLGALALDLATPGLADGQGLCAGIVPAHNPSPERDHHMSKSKSSKATGSLASQATLTVCPIALNKLVPSKENVRQDYAAESIEQLAASILAHGLLQNLTVRPERDAEGAATGNYEVPAGGRRLAALKLLAKRKQIAKDAPIPCNLRDDGIAAELSLAENIERENLHPADEFEAFARLHGEKGQSPGEIAARFGVAERLVRERLKLGSVSPKLLALYRAGEMTLEEIMAFTVSDDHGRQEEVWEGSPFKPSPRTIREALLEAHVAANDPRARFVDLEAYKAAGGSIVRDLFDEDDGGYLTDPALLERLALDKLTAAVSAIAAEGWKWTLPAVEMPEGQDFGRVYARDVSLSAEQARRLEQIEAELESLEAEMEVEDSADSAARYSILHAEYAQLDEAGRVFDPEDIARSGAIVTIGEDGLMRIVRGLVRPEDEECKGGQEDSAAENDQFARESLGTTGRSGKKAGLSDRLTANLTAHRTLALQDALAQAPGIAIAALTHGLALRLFYPGADNGSLEITLHSASVERFLSGSGPSLTLKKIEDRHEGWAARLPREPGDLWAFVLTLPLTDRDMLLAYCVSQSVNAVEERAKSQPDQGAEYLALALSLDMRNYWQATAQSYFRHVSKDFILEAVREGASDDAARRMADLRKMEMADAAEDALQDSGWLPALLRPPQPIAEPMPMSNAAE